MENAVIVDVEPTPARTYDEVESTKAMLVRTEQRFHLKRKRLAADTAYGTGRFLGWLVGCGIAPHIPVREPASGMMVPSLAATFAGTSGEAARRIAVNFANLPRLLAQSPMDECPFQ
jgi:hypothetical protein